MASVKKGRKSDNKTQASAGPTNRPPALDDRKCQYCLKPGHENKDCNVIARFKASNPSRGSNNGSGNYHRNSRGRGRGGRGRGMPSTNEWFQGRQNQGRSRGRPVYNIGTQEESPDSSGSYEGPQESAPNSHFEDASKEDCYQDEQGNC